MSNLSTAVAAENEILKAMDFTYGYDQAMHNIAVAMQSVVSGDSGNYVIGGKVKAYSSGGMNVSIEPIFAFCYSTGAAVAETQTTEPVSFEAADSENDRIDIVEVRANEVEYEEQKRMFKDPSTSVKTSRTIATKKKIALDVVVKRGSDGSEVAPVADAGFVKIAEVHIGAGTLNITNDMIKNIDARKYGTENSEWTANKTATFNPCHLADVFALLLTTLNEDGTLKNAVVKASHIDFGTESTQVKGSVIPTGQSMSVHGVDFSSSESVGTLLSSLAEHVSLLYQYTNDSLARYSYLNDMPVAASTENIDIVTGGEVSIDGIAVTIGQLVLLKNQTNKVENGFWEVQSGAWNRYSGYTDAQPKAFKNKLIFVQNGFANAKKVFYLNDESLNIGESELVFKEAGFNSEAVPRKFIIRDEEGRAKVNSPKACDDIATKGYVDDLVQENSYTSVSAFEDESMARNLLDVLGIRSVHSDAPATKAEALVCITALKLHYQQHGFRGLRYCDYLDLESITVNGETYNWNAAHKNLRIMIMGFSPFINSGDVGNNGLETPHILFQFRNCPITRRMNETNTNLGGYPESEMYSFLNNEFKDGLADIFGDNLLKIRRIYSNATTTPNYTTASWSWYDDTVFLPQEAEVYGNIWSKSEYDLGYQVAPWKPYRDSTLYKIKRYNGARMWWFNSTPSKWNGGTSFFCGSGSGGRSNYDAGASSVGGVAPAFCVRLV